jgi:poly(A) polymerase
MQLVVENRDAGDEVDSAERSSPGLSGNSVGRGIFPLLAWLNRYFAEQNISSYVVGGLIRDFLLKRETADIDIAVKADAKEMALQIANALNGRFVLLDEVNRIARVVIPEEGLMPAEGRWELDFSTIEDGIEQDLIQRDFTINAMAARLDQLVEHFTELQAEYAGCHWQQILIDPFSGQRDLERGVIRAVTEEIFVSDAIRLLRAVRLAYELGFTIEEETEFLIRRHSDRIAGVAGERVREELLRLLSLSHVENLLPHLDTLGLLTGIIPELEGERGIGQPKEHHWNVFDHSLKAVVAVDFLLRAGDWEYGCEDVLSAVPWSAELREHFSLEVSHGSSRRSLLKMAVLLHDLAKPQTKARDDSGRIRFLGHAKEGAEMVSSVLQRLRFSAREIRLIETLVRHHLRPTQMSQVGLPTQRAIYRYFREVGEAGIDILFLSLADHLATRGPNLSLTNWREHTQLVDYVLARRTEQETRVVTLKLISGDDLTGLFGLKPGPQIGRLLELVHEAQAAGELTTREEALNYLREHLGIVE